MVDPPLATKQCECGEIAKGRYVVRCRNCGNLVIVRDHAQYWSSKRASSSLPSL